MSRKPIETRIIERMSDQPEQPDQPIAAVGDGNADRAPNGTFAHGNKASKGNPYAKRVGELRAALFEAVTPDDLKAVILKLLEQAKAGETASIKELFQRLLGPPEAVDLMERLDLLEQKIEALAENKKSWR